MPSIVINEMRGLNTSRARLQLAKGELSAMQNVRQRPFDNWAKRRGIETALVQDSPVNGIFEWDFDEIVMPMYEAGGTLTFYPQLPFTSTSVGGTVTTITPTPEPDPDPLDPTGTGTAGGISFGVEQAMRAIQERRVRRGGAGILWPTGGIYDDVGNIIDTIPVAVQERTNYFGAISSDIEFPQNGLYRYDCHWIADYPKTLVQSVIDELDTECLQWLASNPEGQTSFTNFTSATFWGGAKPAVTSGNYRTQLATFWTFIKKLTGFSTTASQAGQGGDPNAKGYSMGGPNFRIGPTACFDSISATQTEYQSYGIVWGASGPIQTYGLSRGYPTGLADSAAVRTRGYIVADLTSFKSGSASVYLLLGVPGPSGYTLVAGQSPPVTCDDKFHLYDSGSLPANYTSPLLGDGGVPTIVNDCNIAAPFGTGWYVNIAKVAIVPRFTY